MKSLRPNPLRLARRIKRFNTALLASLAALALTACGNASEPAAASSSLASGVQQILSSSTQAATLPSRAERVAQGSRVHH